MYPRDPRWNLKRTGLVRYLQETALDADFRDLARRDPVASFEGFDLSEPDRVALAAQDEAGLDLLSRAVSSLVSEDRAPAAPPSTPPSGPVLQAHEPLDLYLQLAPVQTADGLRHQATLTATPGTAAAAHIRVSPLTEDRGDQVAVHYQIDLIRSDQARGTPAHRTWDHAVDSPAARAAADRVLQAEPGARRSALDALVVALTERL